MIKPNMPKPSTKKQNDRAKFAGFGILGHAVNDKAHINNQPGNQNRHRQGIEGVFGHVQKFINNIHGTIVLM